jgi:hypothetical protein
MIPLKRPTVKRTSAIPDGAVRGDQASDLQLLIDSTPSLIHTSRRETIEAALAETRGRVSGPSGAAAKLRIPPSCLETRIKALKINKHKFKFGSRVSRIPISGIRGLHGIRAIHGARNRNLSQLSRIFINLEMAGVLPYPRSISRCGRIWVHSDR